MNTLYLKKIRRDLGLNQQEFADLIGVNRRTMFSYEQTGKMPESKRMLIEMIIKNHEGNNSEEIIKPEKKQKAQTEDVEKYTTEIESLKDHINTLKGFLAEKTKLASIYEEENKDLKSRLSVILDKEKVQ